MNLNENIKPIGNFRGYLIYLSKRKDKKYFALVNGKRVYFGAKGMSQYYDKIGYYDEYNNYSNKRKRLYYLRHSKNYPEGSADWFSKQLLW